MAITCNDQKFRKDQKIFLLPLSTGMFNFLQVFNTIYSVFHMHGAVEIETPVFELKVSTEMPFQF